MNAMKMRAVDVCQLMWKGNAVLGSALALAGGMVCGETFGYSLRFNFFGCLMNGFLAGNIAVIVGASAAVCSLWRIRGE